MTHRDFFDALRDLSPLRINQQAGDEPFLLVYLFRNKNEEFGAAREARFAALHAQLAQGEMLA